MRAAGAAYSTATELQQYVQGLVKGTFLSDTLQERRLASVKPIEGSVKCYGLGIVAYKSFFGHNGGLPGYTSSMYHSLEHDCTIIIWYNIHGSKHLPQRKTKVL